MRLLIISCLLLASALAQTVKSQEEADFEASHDEFMKWLKQAEAEIKELEKNSQMQQQSFSGYNDGLQANNELQDQIVDKAAEEAAGQIQAAQTKKSAAEKAAEEAAAKAKKELDAEQAKLNAAKQGISDAESEAKQQASNAEEQKATVIQAAEEDGKAKVANAQNDLQNAEQTVKEAEQAKSQEDADIAAERQEEEKQGAAAQEEAKKAAADAAQEQAEKIKKIDDARKADLQEKEGEISELKGAIEQKTAAGQQVQDQIEAEAEAFSKEVEQKDAEVQAAGEQERQEIKQKQADEAARQEQKAEQQDAEYEQKKKEVMDKASQDEEKLQAETQKQEDDLAKDIKKQEQKVQKQTADKARADAQVEINKQGAQMEQEAKNKVSAEQTQAKEDYAPLKQKLKSWEDKTALLKKQTKEMLAHGNSHFSEGIDKLAKMREAHSKEVADFNKEQSVAALVDNEQLSLPLIFGLSFTNILTAGYAYSFYRSTKQMRNFHSSLMEF